jgi:GNAT superfamily N-acetyltransferase
MPSISMEHIRLMTEDDIADAFELSAMAGWNQTREDWRMLLELAPAGCFAIEVDRLVAATTTLLCHGARRLAWIGMVLTKPQYRHRGLARRLLAHALDQADALAIETVKLDATEQGQPLYEKFGFCAEQPVERWFRPGTSDAVNSGPRSQWLETSLEAWRALDMEAFGADRSSMLRKLSARSTCRSVSKSYLFTRPGRQSEYLGPCVSDDPATARALIAERIRTGASAGWSWDLLPENRDAVAIATDLGFTEQRRLLRMVRGKDLRGRQELIYAIAGFELG